MTEVVTSTAAVPQLSLLASRQQVFVVEREGVDAGFASADTAPTAVDHSADTFAQARSSHSDDENPVNHHQDQSAPAPRAEAPVSGPSRPRIEIKHIDFGLTPSEVVGTPDTLQRLDTNGDGHIDQSEAARGGLAREGVFTFAALAGGQQSETANNNAQQEVTAAPSDTPSADAPAAVQSAVVPDVASTAPATPGTTTVVAGKKFFVGPDVSGTQTRKFAAAVAAQGTPTGVVDAPKKFYGQGAEVVVGKFAVDTHTPKFVEKTVEKPKIVTTEDGTGEAKTHTKVPQTETAHGGTDQGAGQSTYEKAQRVAAAESQAKKVVLVEVAAYSDAAAAPDAASAATVVTA